MKLLRIALDEADNELQRVDNRCNNKAKNIFVSIDKFQ